MIDSRVVRLNNWVTRLRKVKAKPENILVLFPRCIQWSKCPHNIGASLDNCRRCGKCRVKDILELGERLGLQLCFATGGRQAAQRVNDDSVKAILAVACEKELREGMFAVFPKPVIGIVNLRPNGPCVDTDVDMKEVESGIREFLLDSEGGEVKEETGNHQK